MQRRPRVNLFQNRQQFFNPGLSGEYLFYIDVLKFARNV